MKKDISNRVKSMLVVITMLLTALTVAITVSSTTVTNNNAPASAPSPGATDVFVMDFTLTDAGTDTVIAGATPTDGSILASGEDGDWFIDSYDSSNTDSWNSSVDYLGIDDDSDTKYTAQADGLLAGATTNLGAGDTLSTTADTDWQGITTVGTVSYYDAVDTDAWNSSADAIWEEGVADDAYTAAGDTLLAGTAPPDTTAETGDGGKDSDWTTVNLYDHASGAVWDVANDAIIEDFHAGGTYSAAADTDVAGTTPSDGTAYTSDNDFDSDWTTLKSYDDTDTDVWDVSNDAIIEELDGNDAYHDSLDSITITNSGGTADSNNISAVSLWAEDGTTSGFQNDEDTHLGETTLGGTISNIYQTIPPAGQRFYVTVNLSGTAYSANTIKMSANVDLNSTDDPDPSENSNTQSVGKLGVHYFEGTEEGAVNVITTDTQNLKYGVTTDIVVDTSQLTDGQFYYLYRPYYVRTGSGGSYTYELQWEPVMTGGGEQVSIDGSKTSDTMQSISLDYAGMWILDNDNDPSDVSGDGTDTDFAYFWVNSSSPYTIEYTPSSVYYGKNETVQIIVKEEGETVGAWIDVFRESDDSRVFHTWESDGTFSFNSDWLNNLSYAGNYTIKAYTDIDVTKIGYGEYGYSENYGYTNPSITGTNYSALCGPWDPYEKNATTETIRVKTGEPDAVAVAGNNTMYWDFSGEVNITIVGYDGENLIGADANLNVKAFNEEDNEVTSNLTIDSSNINKGYIHISNNSWGKDDEYSYGGTGTWYVYIYLNTDGDSGAKEYTEEWNTTVEWTVAAGPDAQWKWVDDDGSVGGVDLWGYQKSNNDGIIPYIPEAGDVPLDVEFYVYGEDGSYFGQDPTGIYSGTCQSVKECAENITISGNSLFTGKLSDFPGYVLEPLNCGYSDGVWSVPIVPTMSLGGGEITINVIAFNSSCSGTILIGGENYGKNGSIVSVTPNDFMIDQENKTLTITVQNSETGVENPYMDVYLYYLDDGTKTASPSTMKPITDHIVSHVEAVGGVYTISFNTTQQTANQTDGAGFGDIMAPRNLTVYVSGSGHREGYALIQMKPVNDLETHISVETFMAGLDYDDVVISCDFVNGTAGKSDTDTPSTDDKDSFFMKIVDENGDDVTGTTSSDGVLHNFYDDVLTGAYSVEKDNVYGLDAGMYSIYAWNNTHNSEGHNATFEIKAVEVTCDKAPFIWSVDANISATFTITYNGNPANGTLRIDNMSDKGTYNSTWRNCSFTGTSDAGAYTSLQISKTKIINGVVTVHDITADALTEDKSKEYITFWFKSTESGSVFAKAAAQMTVEVPSVTPDPEYIPLGRTTKVYCTATGRGDTLSGVFIRLHGQGFDQNSTTDVDGRVVFSVTPASTGNISIDVGETGRTLPDTVVYVVAWIIDVDVVAEVDEGEQFTVTVTKEGTTDVVVGATVTIKGIGTATTDANGEVTFTAPDVTSDRTYTIKVTAEGYAPDPDTNTITVINTPKLILVIPDKVQATATFDVAVADDTGGPIIGAIITFNEKMYTTGVNGIAKLTAPKAKGDYPIEATFGTYVKATDIVTVTAAPGIPGFELLSLIAALGVAFILFRHRRRR